MSIIQGSGMKRTTIPKSLEYEDVTDDPQDIEEQPAAGARKKKKLVKRDAPHVDTTVTSSSQLLTPVQIKG